MKQMTATIVFDFDNNIDSATLAKYLRDRLNYTLSANQLPDFAIASIEERK